MDRIARIIELDKLIDDTEGEVNDMRWEQARLLHEELATGTTLKAIADELGKSITHVFRYKKAWAVYGNVMPKPKFSLACEEANPQGSTRLRERLNTGYEPKSDATHRGRHRRTAEREPEDEAPSEHEGARVWVRTADDALSQLIIHKAAGQFIDDEDKEILRGLPDKVRKVLRMYG